MSTQTTFEGIPDKAQKPASAEEPAQIGATAGQAPAARLPDWCAGMLALSIRQPWATSIVHFGKPVENRVWKGRYLQLQLDTIAQHGDRFLIHAAKGMDQDDIDGWRDLVDERPECKPTPEQMAAAGVKTLRDLPRGGIIGVARFVTVVERHPSPWFTGPLALVFKDVAPLPFVPCRGFLGFFRPQF